MGPGVYGKLIRVGRKVLVTVLNSWIQHLLVRILVRNISHLKRLRRSAVSASFFKALKTKIILSVSRRCEIDLTLLICDLLCIAVSNVRRAFLSRCDNAIGNRVRIVALQVHYDLGAPNNALRCLGQLQFSLSKHHCHGAWDDSRHCPRNTMQERDSKEKMLGEGCVWSHKFF